MNFESMIFPVYLTLLIIVFPLFMDIYVYLQFRPKIGDIPNEVERFKEINYFIIDFINFIHYKYRKLLGFKNRAIIILFDTLLSLLVIALIYYTNLNMLILMISTVIYFYLIYLIRCRIYSKLLINKNMCINEQST